MGMYTDWGNLKVVSQGAWWDGRTQWLNGVPLEWAQLGASILPLRPKSQKDRPKRVNWALRRSSGSLVSAFDSEATGEFA